MNDETSGRLRPHPDERFKSPQHLIDLERAARELSAEEPAPSGPAQHGHRQKTLYRHGSLTIALFLFDAGAGLAEHQAEGVVTIQVLQGRISISAEDQQHTLTAGRMLVLAPGVRHDVRAEQPTRMLLTVSMEASAPASTGS